MENFNQVSLLQFIKETKELTLKLKLKLLKIIFLKPFKKKTFWFRYQPGLRVYGIVADGETLIKLRCIRG